MNIYSYLSENKRPFFGHGICFICGQVVATMNTKVEFMDVSGRAYFLWSHQSCSAALCAVDKNLILKSAVDLDNGLYSKLLTRGEN